MHQLSAAYLLQAAMWVYVVAGLGSLAALRREKLANLIGFGGAALAGVCGLAAALVFLLAWELMALTAYCLVSFEHEKTETRNAGVLYFIMSHIGTGCLILGFLILFQAAGGVSPGDYAFDRFRAIRDQLSPGQRDAVFL